MANPPPKDTSPPASPLTQSAITDKTEAAIKALKSKDFAYCQHLCHRILSHPDMHHVCRIRVHLVCAASMPAGKAVEQVKTALGVAEVWSYVALCLFPFIELHVS